MFKHIVKNIFKLESASYLEIDNDINIKKFRKMHLFSVFNLESEVTFF